MNQKQIQVGNKKLLALDMPEGVCTVKLLGDSIISYGENVRIGLPYGKHVFIGFKNDITEEQWKEIVPFWDSQYSGIATTAKSVGLKLLELSGIDYLNCLIIQVI